MNFDIIAHLYRAREWSRKTFGPGMRVEQTLKHITKEQAEVRKDPYDVYEWLDIASLAIDGAMRAGHSPEAICTALFVKQGQNEEREWPDWRTMPIDEPVEHIRKEG